MCAYAASTEQSNPVTTLPVHLDVPSFAVTFLRLTGTVNLQQVSHLLVGKINFRECLLPALQTISRTQVDPNLLIINRFPFFIAQDMISWYLKMKTLTI